jgi:osmoprotectant transport system substrate-binding protein
MRSSIRWRALGAALVAFALLAAACGDDDGSGEGAKEDTPITVSSFNFGESEILAEIYAQALERDGYTIERKLNLGNREVVKPALESGEIDLVPEYVGTVLNFLGGEPTPDSAATHTALVDAYGELGIAVLDYADAQDRNAIVVTAETADEFGIAAISDLAGPAAELSFGGPPECPERPSCLIGLTDAGITFAEFLPLDAGGPLTKAALEGGEIEVALLFSTDAAIAINGWVLLEDDIGLNPADNIVPVVRQEIVDAFGDDFIDLIDGVSAKIDTTGLTELNRQQSQDGDDPAQIAGRWLDENGY